jgi:hypothetical protein
VKGLSPAQIGERYLFTPAEIERALRRAERLGLCTFEERVRGSGGPRVFLRVSRYVEWIEDGPLYRMYDAAMKVDFLDADFKGRLEVKRFVTGSLTERSQQVIHRKVQKLLGEIREMVQMDGTLGNAATLAPPRTMTILVGLREWTPGMMTKYRREPPRGRRGVE